MTKLQIFKKEVERWVEVLGLKDWSMSIIEAKTTEKDRKAECWCSYADRTAGITVNEDWLSEGKPTDQEIRRTAFHEVCEVLLWNLEEISASYPKNSTLINSERHAIIRRLENGFFK